MLGVSLDGSCEAKYATLETCSILATVPWACIHTRSLALFFFIIKTLVVSHFLCASRWKPLKMSNETLWFYCDGILQHTVQQCTEAPELPACRQCGMLPALFPWDRASRWWSCPASRTHAGNPGWLCPALWYLSHLLFQRWLSFSLLLHRAWMCPGRLPCPCQSEGNLLSQHNFKIVVSLARGISHWRVAYQVGDQTTPRLYLLLGQIRKALESPVELCWVLLVGSLVPAHRLTLLQCKWMRR